MSTRSTAHVRPPTSHLSLSSEALPFRALCNAPWPRSSGGSQLASLPGSFDGLCHCRLTVLRQQLELVRCPPGHSPCIVLVGDHRDLEGAEHDLRSLLGRCHCGGLLLPIYCLPLQEAVGQQPDPQQSQCHKASCNLTRSRHEAVRRCKDRGGDEAVCPGDRNTTGLGQSLRQGLRRAAMHNNREALEVDLDPIARARRREQA
mmetsp:Transcript_51823/g.150740  ORF Transcript_51823/g.150740 Transcript_51823/m.150740 type:complete len:203 (+) Transcript_51823:13-621(+)